MNKALLLALNEHIYLQGLISREIINFKSRNQKIKDREGKYGILN